MRCCVQSPAFPKICRLLSLASSNPNSSLKRRGRDRRASAEGPAATIAGNSVISKPTHVSFCAFAVLLADALRADVAPDEVLEARIADLPFAEDTVQRLTAMARD